MKESVGVIKEIDRLGRIVIPKDFRDRIGLESKVEITLTNDGILIKNPEYVLVKKSTNSHTKRVMSDVISERLTMNCNLTVA